MTLRLYRGGTRVAVVAVTPRTRRIRDRGAVKVLHGSRIARRGQMVSARLRLRLDRSLADRQLHLEVEAIDIRRARQTIRRAGSIPVQR
jgi:hypothetical protein